MRQEYLFTEPQHRNAVEQYSIDSCERKIHDIRNSTCWIVIFSKSGENEDSAKVLSSVHHYMMKNFHPTVLINGCSAYYNKALYPHFNEFERKLRNLLYLKSALSPDNKNAKVINDLESKTFGEMFTLLFSDPLFITSTKTSVNKKSWQFTKDEIIAAIQNLPENTVWDNLMGKDAVPLFRSKFLTVKQYRNDVMHAHNMETTTYHDAVKLIKEINKQLDAEINMLKDNSQDSANKNFNTVISDAIKNMDEIQAAKSWQEQLLELKSIVPTFPNESLVSTAKTLSNIFSSELKIPSHLFSSPQWDSVQQDIQQSVQTFAKIQAASEQLSASMASIRQAMSHQLYSSQDHIESKSLTPGILELSEKSKKSIGGNTDNDQNETGDA